MAAFGQTINICLLVGLAVLTWVLPRRFWLLGMLGAQILVAIGFLVMGIVAVATGVWEQYDDGLAILGLLFQAFLFNCLVLPVALVALWRHRRERRASCRLKHGLCTACGYDLRASKDRCPECGTQIPPASR